MKNIIEQRQELFRELFIEIRGPYRLPYMNNRASLNPHKVEAFNAETARLMVEKMQREINKVIERYEDKGDERYGLAKHNNTILQRIEDDLLQSLTKTL